MHCWTHSTFGFENKNGCLKHIFHGKTNIVDQLLLNTDVLYTSHCVHNKLADVESEETIAYIDYAKSLGPKTKRGMYWSPYLCRWEMQGSSATVEQSSALDLLCNSIDVFSKLLQDRTYLS